MRSEVCQRSHIRGQIKGIPQGRKYILLKDVGIVRKKKIDDRTISEMEKSGLMTSHDTMKLKMECASEKELLDRVEEILRVKHSQAIAKIKSKAGLEIFVEESAVARSEKSKDAKVDLEIESDKLDLRGREKDRDAERELKTAEGKSEIATRIIREKEDAKLRQLELVMNIDDPEKILAVLSAISAESAEALKVKYDSVSKDEFVAFAKEQSAREQDNMKELTKEAMKGMSDVASAKQRPVLHPRTICHTPVPVAGGTCPKCNS